jgi:hypothetical protein
VHPSINKVLVEAIVSPTGSLVNRTIGTYRPHTTLSHDRSRNRRLSCRELNTHAHDTHHNE